MLRGNRIYLILSGIVLLAIMIVVITGIKHTDPKKAISDPVVLKEPDHQVVYVEKHGLIQEESTISTKVIEDGLRDMGVLITEEYYFTEVSDFTSVKKLFKTDIELKFTESSYLVSYDGVVNAGIDFDKINITKDDDQKELLITIPAATIRTTTVDPSSFVLHSEKNGLGNPVSISDFNKSLTELESTAQQKAIERGILDRADENAKAVISNFIRGFENTAEYSIRFAKQ